jgi:cation-transporting ATPase E
MAQAESQDDLEWKVSPAVGLSSGDVAERITAGHVNRVTNSSSRSLWEILRSNVLTLFNAIVLGSFLVLLLLGQWKDALFGFAAISNSIIGVVQEYRAKRLLDRLAIVEAPRARVLREGVVLEIPREDVVLDDLLVLRTGDQVIADATVLRTDGMELDESLLTGESEPVEKQYGMDLLSGSSVVAGQGEARVIRVGAGSFANRITAEAKRFSLVNSEIRRGIDRIMRWVTWALLPVVVIVANGQMQALGGWEYAITTGVWKSGVAGAVASVIAMVPLGLVLLASVAFTVGSVRLARQMVLIQELDAVEGLARVDILCLDKTGTLTEGSMLFDAVHDVDDDPPAGWSDVLGWFGADPNANATARCLSGVFAHDGTLRSVSSIEFSSVRKWGAVSFASGDTVGGTWVLGTPGMVLTEGDPSAEQTLVDAARLASSGLRTLVLAHAPAVTSVQDARLAVIPKALVPVVLLTFREKLRPDASHTLDYFRQQGVGIRVISGDNPGTVASVAREVGLDVDEGYDARQLPEDPEELGEVMENHLVFGWVTPEQKKRMVLALRGRGHVVAMTGDGINDVPALKEADIGIAMDTAAPATKAVSRLVLLDGRFDRLPGVVAEGRRVIANLERVSVLFLSKTVYAIAISVAFGALLWSFPLLPRQLFIIDGPTIGIPAFFLALMANNRRYRPGFFKRSLSLAVPAGLTVTIVIVFVNAYSRIVGGYSDDAVRTASLLGLDMVAMWLLIAKSRPLNFLRVVVIIAMYATLVLLMVVPLTASFFTIEWPPPSLLAVSLGAGAAGSLCIELLFRGHTRRYPLSAGTTPT